MRCDKCKYWEAQSDDGDFYYGAEDGFGRCRKILHQEDVRAEINGNDSYKSASWDMRQKIIMTKLRLNKAYVADASDYAGALWTLPDFGCVGFEPK